MTGTLCFAGEATCGGGLNATMEGALRSGLRRRRSCWPIAGVGLPLLHGEVVGDPPRREPFVPPALRRSEFRRGPWRRARP